MKKNLNMKIPNQRMGTVITNSDSSNMRAAMDKVAESLTHTISPVAKDDDAPIDKSVLIRTTEAERERWKQAAAAEQISLSAWIRDRLNSAAAKVLDCEHPESMVRRYPWSVTCTKCGKRLS